MTDPPDTPPQPMRICTPEEQQELLQLREREQNLAAARKAYLALEQERNEIYEEHADARRKIAALEAERDRLSLLEANFESYKVQWKRHYETEADKRIPETNEAIHRLAAAFGLDEYTAQSAVDGVIQLWGESRTERDRLRNELWEAIRTIEAEYGEGWRTEKHRAVWRAALAVGKGGES